MISNYFVIGDVHGKAGMLESILQYWNGEDQLIFLGDLIDRGENGRAVLERVKGLVEQKKLFAYRAIMNICFWLG